MFFIHMLSLSAVLYNIENVASTLLSTSKERLRLRFRVLGNQPDSSVESRSSEMDVTPTLTSLSASDVNVNGTVQELTSEAMETWSPTLSTVEKDLNKALELQKGLPSTSTESTTILSTQRDRLRLHFRILGSQMQNQSDSKSSHADFTPTVTTPSSDDDVNTTVLKYTSEGMKTWTPTLALVEKNLNKVLDAERELVASYTVSAASSHRAPSKDRLRLHFHVEDQTKHYWDSRSSDTSPRPTVYLPPDFEDSQKIYHPYATITLVDEKDLDVGLDSQKEPSPDEGAETDHRKNSKEKKEPYLTMVIIAFFDLIQEIKNRHLKEYTDAVRILVRRLMRGDYFDFIFELSDFILKAIVFPAAELPAQAIKARCEELKARYMDTRYFTDEQIELLDFANEFISKEDYEDMTSNFDDIKLYPRVNRTDIELCQDTLSKFLEPFRRVQKTQYFINFYKEFIKMMAKEYPDNFPQELAEQSD